MDQQDQQQQNQPPAVRKPRKPRTTPHLICVESDKVLSAERHTKTSTLKAYLDEKAPPNTPIQIYRYVGTYTRKVKTVSSSSIA